MNAALLSEKLSAARNLSHFQGEVERYAGLLTGNKPAYYFRYDGSQDSLSRQGKTFAVDATTQPGTCILLSEPCSESLPLPEVESGEGTVSLPTRHFGQLVGVLTLSIKPEEANSEKLVRYLKLVGVLQEQVQSREEMKAHQDRTRDLMVAAVEALGSCHGHVRRVAQICSELANLLDLSAQIKAQLFEAAHYHDVGLLALQDKTTEQAQQAHCQAGADFLRATRSLSHLAHLVENHHERYDGTGFPNGRQGDDLLVECWVLSLAEHLEETWRQKPRETFEEKIKSFFKEEVKAHHPEVVDALCGLVDSGRLQDIME